LTAPVPRVPLGSPEPLAGPAAAMLAA